MPDYQRDDDFLLITAELDFNSVQGLRVAMPRACRLIKAYSAKSGSFQSASTVLFASDAGTLTDTLIIPTAGAVGDVAEQDYREEGNNAFARGTALHILSDGTPSSTSLAILTLVFRPL